MSPHPLVMEAERLLDQDHLDPDEVVELARRVRSHPPEDTVSGRSLLALIDTLTRRAAVELQTMETALKQASASRKALSKYGYLSPATKNQRANKVV